MNLEKEAILFLHSVLTGVIVFALYMCLQVLRRLIPHKKCMIQIEDFLYWILMAVYLFVQIYHTNNGKIRWYSVLGIVVGGVLLWKSFAIFRKYVEKLYTHMKRKFRKKY